MLRALAERGVRPDVIVTTSVGAVNGAFVGSRRFDLDSVEELAGIRRGMRRGKVFPAEPVAGLLGLLCRRQNLVPAMALRRLIARHVEQERLEDLPIPLHVIACDVLSGAELRLSRGPLVEAVLASSAIPGVFPPVEWEGRLAVRRRRRRQHADHARLRLRADARVRATDRRLVRAHGAAAWRPGHAHPPRRACSWPSASSARRQPSAARA